MSMARSAEKYKKRLMWSIAALALATIVFSGMVMAKGAGDSDSKPLLTIDGEAVPEAEFQFFLQDERALTANNYYLKYGADGGVDFWDTAFDGKTPLESAREQALDKLLRAKMEALIAVENKVIEADISYESLMKNRQEKNEQRDEQMEQGETFYGLSFYDEYQFYNYERNEVWAKLLKWKVEQDKPDDKLLMELYKKEKEIFNMGHQLEYMVLRADGSTHLYDLSEDDISKGDTQTLYLWYELAKLEPHEQLTQVEYKGEMVDVLLLSKKSRGYRTFQEAKGVLLQLYGEEQLLKQVEERISQATIEINEEPFSKLRFAQ